MKLFGKIKQVIAISWLKLYETVGQVLILDWLIFISLAKMGKRHWNVLIRWIFCWLWQQAMVISNTVIRHCDWWIHSTNPGLTTKQVSVMPYLYPPHKVVVGGYIGFYTHRTLRPSVCPSILCLSRIRPASRVRSVASTVLVGSISYSYILSSNFSRCVTCKVSCKISNFEFLAFFKNL